MKQRKFIHILLLYTYYNMCIIVIHIFTDSIAHLRKVPLNHTIGIWKDNGSSYMRVVLKLLQAIFLSFTHIRDTDHNTSVLVIKRTRSNRTKVSVITITLTNYESLNLWNCITICMTCNIETMPTRGIDYTFHDRLIIFIYPTNRVAAVGIDFKACFL